MLSGIYPFGNLKFSSVHHCYHSLPYKVASGEGRGVITTFFPTVLGWLLLEKAMAAHSSTLAWKIPWTEEPGRLQSMGLQSRTRLQSMGSQRVRHDWATSLSLFTFMHWRRKRQLTPVFLPGKSQGQQSLVGCRLWVAELDMTEAMQQQQQQQQQASSYNSRKVVLI